VGNYNAYFAAQKRKILDEICSHMPLPKNSPYTDEELELIALKYNRRSDFRINAPGAYDAARNRGTVFLDKICSHMPKHSSIRENHHSFKWTHEALIIEAKKYSTLNSFKKGNPSAYVSTRRKGIPNKILGLEISRGVSSAEKELLELIKKIYPSTKNIRHTNIEISNKPHIKGFEIDIFIPELNKGIEFDGTYWHSFEGLKSSRKKWSDEDILNYHVLKDEYFASQGIQILHIKEESWIKDKKKCIQKCFEFLLKSEVA
jgi:hypothetical protein